MKPNIIKPPHYAPTQVCVFRELFILIILCVFTPVCSQTMECGTLQTPDSVMSKNPWKGNNRYLVGVLRKAGYDVPDDYFSQVDERGHFQGRRARLEEFDPKSEKYQGPDRIKNDKNNGRSDESSSFENLIVGGQTVRYIRVRAFIHKDVNGAGYDVSEVQSYFDYTNQVFRDNNVPIAFYIACGDIMVINNSNYANPGSTLDCYSMFYNYGFGGDAFSAHFVRTAYSGGHFVAGLAWGTPGAALLVTQSGSAQTLAHELGHCLGLQHTHNPHLPCVENGNEDCADCWQEPVSRTMTQPVWCLENIGQKKCEVYGDQLADTPGEPNLLPAITAACTINWSAVDPTDNWNTQWTPAQFNMMSYAGTCRDEFSIGQIAVMLASIPYFATTTDPYSVSGPGAVCKGETHIFSIPSLPGVSYYTWQVPYGASIVSGQGTTQISVSFSTGGNKDIIVSPSCGFPWSKKSVAVADRLSVTGLTTVYTNDYVNYTTYFPQATHDWVVPAGWTVVSGQGTSYVTVLAPSVTGSGYITANVYTAGCVKSPRLFVTVQSSGGPQYLRAASNDLDPSNVENDLLSVDVIDLQTGRRILSVDPAEHRNYLSELKGIYILKKKYSNRVETQKILLK